MADLTTELCGITLANPTILASGVLGTSKALIRRVARNGAGAVTIKSVSLEPRGGHANPTILTFDAGMINAVGYSNFGIEEAEREYADLSEVGCPVIGSLIGTNAEEFARMAERMALLPFAALELPLSCPHTPGYGTLAGQSTPEATAEITAAVRKVTKKPIIVKVSPNVPAIGEIARAARDAGADAITAVNSMGPGMLINIEARAPMLAFKMGGVTGAALHPVALRCVYDIRQSVELPIIGTGGVRDGRTAIAMLMAGATAVGVGSAVHDDGMHVFDRISREMREWMDANGVKSVKELIGAAHG
jgi:dihydroorotate dehydrogenase (NAD+) catalytic subunit